MRAGIEEADWDRWLERQVPSSADQASDVQAWRGVVAVLRWLHCAYCLSYPVPLADLGPWNSL